jgi:protein phosphatase
MQYWAITDPGCVRTQNQDAYVIEALDGALLCVVCDGMGGAKSGNVASALAAEIFSQAVKSLWKPGLTQADVDAALTHAVKLTNFNVYDQAMSFEDFAGMGTTLAAMLVEADRITIVNVGDSRVYRINASGIHQVTKDHSLVQMMVDRGDLTPEQARSYPGKNMITRAVGTEAAVQCDLFHLAPEWEEILLLCTDGLTNLVEDQEILFEIMYNEDRQACCRRLVDIALSRGAPDNVTCVLVKA